MTIKDIARLSGCGVGTVSRVLNHHPDVTEKTRQKVMAVIEKYNFEPNVNAKYLKMQHRSSIAVLVKGTHNMLFADIVEQVQALLEENGQDSGIYYMDEDANEVEFALQLCKDRNPKGIMFLAGDMEHFRASFGSISIPCIVLTNSAGSLDFQNLSSLSTDNAAAAGRMMDFLIEQGHREIGILGGNPEASLTSHSRLQGCLESFQRHGIPFDRERQYEICRFSMADGYEAASRLLKRTPSLTAMFAFGDVIAIGALRALKDQGKRVPEDISVAGFDGLDSANYSIPRLATIRQDTRRMAERGIDILLRNIERKPYPSHEVVPFQLIAGESVTVPAERGSLLR